MGVLVGGLIGNRFAIGRDKRREFNELADPLFERLETQRIQVSGGSFPSDANSLDEYSFIALRRKLSWIRKRGLDRTLREYEHAKQNCGYFESGLYKFNNPIPLLNAIKKLQRYVRQR